MNRNEIAQCPLSGGQARFYCRKPPADYFLTDQLGLIFQKELPTVEQMSAYAEEQYSAGVYKGYASAAPLKIQTFERRIDLLKRLGARGRILDVGCACGFFIEAALKHGFDAYGIEFSKEAVAIAREEIRSRITVGDVNLLREREEDRFDAVVAFDIIEHTQDPLKFLEEIRQIFASWRLVDARDARYGPFPALSYGLPLADAATDAAHLSFFKTRDAFCFGKSRI